MLKIIQKIERSNAHQQRGDNKMSDNLLTIDEKYETMREFSERTGIKYCSIRTLCIRNELPFIAIGKKRMIPVQRGLQALEKMEVSI